MTQGFTPHNPLEEKLVAMYRKQISISDFLGILIDSRLAIPSDREAAVTAPDMNFKPLVITSAMGFDVLVTFSSLELAEAASSMYPGYGFTAEVDADRFLLQAPENVGFALNPGWHLGFELPPEGLQQILYRFGVKEYKIQY